MSKYIDEYRNGPIAKQLSAILSSYKGREIVIMEVCGTHTMAIFRFGIRNILSKDIRLISGPGCPVCVTPSYYINSALALSNRSQVIITTFGDMMRIPGKEDESLLTQKAKGSDIRIVYSPLDSLQVAKENPSKKVVFLSVGFETTNPVVALTVQKAAAMKLSNFYILTANKTIPQALKVLCNDSDIGVNGFLYPGHVSSIIGTSLYDDIAKEFGVTGVVAGFEPLDIMSGMITLIHNINSGKREIENLYKRVVHKEGNETAQQIVQEIFKPCDAVWRGIGEISQSGLKLKSKYQQFDAWKEFDLSKIENIEPKGCMCGEVLRGRKTPLECPLFGGFCTPKKPVGACMVSSEGTCSAFYKYGELV